MGLGSIFFLAIGLSMDAFAVSISSGARAKHRLLQHALIMALFFGVFQAVMPALGWLVGFGFQDLIKAFDHWVAFGLLSFLGGRMIFESLKEEVEDAEENRAFSLTLSLLLTLSIATSIDALAVGISMAFLKASILLPITVIGVVTFCISGVGVVIGHKCGAVFGKKFELVGGLILIAIGAKILISHLF